MKTSILFTLTDLDDNSIQYMYTHNTRIGRNEVTKLTDNHRLEKVFNDNRNKVLNYVIHGNESSKPLIFEYWFSPTGGYPNLSTMCSVNIDDIEVQL